MTQKKALGLLVSAFVCAAVFTMNPSAAWGSGDVGAPAAGAPGGPPNAPAAVPAPAPERIVPAPPPAGAFLCPTP
ncbi:hypothetical protein ACWCW7_04190 [Nocardia tengchongensis]|uniref:hypothetical protein n=1 Tax=Nocardia tengchongensis TaxID=2055889 RepID=UPI0036B67B91